MSSEKMSQARIQAMLKQRKQGKPALAPRPALFTRMIEIALIGSLAAAGTYWFLHREKKLPGMIPIPAGCFEMGAAETDQEALHSEKPQHRICVDAFLMDANEVTQGEYLNAMGANPSHISDCITCPVENVTWHEAVAYCQQTGKRLPTEAEWEYAVRAGSSTAYFWGDDFATDYSWNSFNSKQSTHPVRTSLPNAWRLYDMTGNVWEWVADWADNEYYQKSPTQNPRGPREGTSRIVRGGSFNAPPRYQRSAARGWAEPHERLHYVGFRCAR